MTALDMLAHMPEPPRKWPPRLENQIHISQMLALIGESLESGRFTKFFQGARGLCAACGHYLESGDLCQANGGKAPFAAMAGCALKEKISNWALTRAHGKGHAGGPEYMSGHVNGPKKSHSDDQGPKGLVIRSAIQPTAYREKAAATHVAGDGLDRAFTLIGPDAERRKEDVKRIKKKKPLEGNPAAGEIRLW